MNKNILVIVLFILVSAILYIVVIIQPELIFHHVQPPFIFSTVFYRQYLNYPGGPSELVANLLMQSFYYKITGPFVLLAIAFSIGWLMYQLIDSIYQSAMNLIWAAIPFVLTMILVSNYNFPFAAVVSVTLILLFLFFLTKAGKGFIASIVIYIAGSIAIYWLAGSGYMTVFSFSALFVSLKMNKWFRVSYSIFIVAFAFLFPLLASNYLFAVSLKHQYFMFFAPKAWFMKYEPSLVFVFYVVSIPALLLITSVYKVLIRKNSETEKKQIPVLKFSIAAIMVILIAVMSHVFTFSKDAKRIIKADYFCYQNKADKTTKYATILKEYNFAANLNYNLVMSKTNQLTENFFSFMQIKGNESLHPDVEFASEYSFIAIEFYYELGFISEAKHWAYESLVFYPYSLRAMQNLVKIHLVNGEYKAAERMLNTMSKGLTGIKFIREYLPFIKDTSLVATNTELMEKRSFMPVEKELNTTIEGRFKELLEANVNNKKAFEYLMLFYLAGAQLDDFSELVENAGRYFDKMPAVYEEALLMHSARTGKTLPATIEISRETNERFNNFTNELEKYRGKTRIARNSLYARYGKTYMYFLQFVYPNIIEPVIVNDEDDYPEI